MIRPKKTFKTWIIRIFGLKGSWSWAKRQMMAGNVVRGKHWTGTLKLKIDSPENTLLLATFSREKPYKWETSNYHLSKERYTDYEVVI